MKKNNSINRIYTRLRQYKTLALLASDTLLLILINLICSYFSGKITPLGVLFPTAVYLIVFMAGGVYSNLWRYAQIREYSIYYLNTLGAGLLWILLDRAFGIGPEFDRAHYVIVMLCSSSLCIILRILLFKLHSPFNKTDPAKSKKRLLIVGAGSASLYLINEIRSNQYSELEPVAAVDDDPEKLHHYVSGVYIAGTCDMIPEIARDYDINLIYIAIPSADYNTRARLLGYCSELTCEVKILPYIEQLDLGSSLRDNIRDVTIDELLGREPIRVADELLGDFIDGKVVLVTGGGGSIGSELCRQIAAQKPKRLVIVDIYENNAYDIEQELRTKYGKSLDLSVLIASVRDFPRMRDIMIAEAPQLVIHAAAHKHVPLMETSPQEAVKNNIFGTYNTARAALEAGVSNFILISTDKAVNPTNIMGASKRLCEMVIQALACESIGTTFAAVRFGNVLGSNGSVIPLFKKQIAAGGPVTVTHPEITRFFMSIPEAAQLVLAAGKMAKGGEIFVLDMGSPIKIDTLARQLIKMSGLVPDKDIKIEYVGLRPGEKLYEELLMSEEKLRSTDNKKIFIGRPTILDPSEFFHALSELREIAQSNPAPEVIERELMKLVPTFKRAEIK